MCVYIYIVRYHSSSTFRPGSRCLAWCFVERRHGIHYKFNVFRRHISAVCVVVVVVVLVVKVS